MTYRYILKTTLLIEFSLFLGSIAINGVPELTTSSGGLLLGTGCLAKSLSKIKFLNDGLVDNSFCNNLTSIGCNLLP